MKKIMKTNSIILAMFALTSTMTISPNTFAADGTINFEGEIVASACTVSVSNTRISMGNFSPSAFKQAGVAVGNAGFIITVNDCPSSIANAKVLFDGDHNATDPTLIALSSASKATGLGIGIFDDTTGAKIPLGTSSDDIQLTTVSGKNVKTGTKKFNARYVSTLASVGDGSANGSVTYTIQYN
jgi:major type 1 subunit fimbrin (pilin)